MLRDCIVALRVILKTPLLTAVAVGSLALGVAANTTVFSVVESFLLRSFPYEQPDRLLLLWENTLADAESRGSVSPANYFDWKERATSFEGMTAGRFGPAHWGGVEQPLRLDAGWVSPEFFDVLGAAPLDGRTFSRSEGAQGSPPVVVVSEGFWRSHLGAESSLGRELMLDGVVHTVVGVMPATFDFFFGSADLWIADDHESKRQEREDGSLIVVGRLRDGVQRAQAQQELTSIAEVIAAESKEVEEGTGVLAEGFRDLFPGPVDRRLVKILQSVVLLVLLVACVNVASLLLAKAGSRQREMALRTALGASRARLLRQLLIESALMAVVAGALGLGLSVFGVRYVATAMPDFMPLFLRPGMNPSVILFGVGVSAIAGLAFGIGPALQSTRIGNLRRVLGDGGRGGTVSSRRKRALEGLVVAEFGLALTILAGAAVLTDLFHSRLAIDPGFETEGVLAAELSLSEVTLAEDEEISAFVQELEPRLAEIPGVRGVGFVSRLPRARSMPTTDLVIPGRETSSSGSPSVQWMSVSPSYLETMGIGVRRGRSLSVEDRRDASGALLVNERFVELHFPDENPVGRHIELHDRSWEIVGVVGNTAQSRLAGLLPFEPLVYLPMDQYPVRSIWTVLQVEGEPLEWKEQLQAAVWSLGPDQPVSRIRSLEDHLFEQVAGPEIMSQILFAVGLLALMLAAIGTYGIMAFQVSQRTGEIGIRIALGARPFAILTQVSRRGLTLTGIGFLLGVPLAAVVVHLVHSLFELGGGGGFATEQSLSVLPLASAAGILVLVGLGACLIPASKALSIDPTRAIQGD